MTQFSSMNGKPMEYDAYGNVTYVNGQPVQYGNVNAQPNQYAYQSTANIQPLYPDLNNFNHQGNPPLAYSSTPPNYVSPIPNHQVQVSYPPYQASPNQPFYSDYHSNPSPSSYPPVNNHYQSSQQLPYGNNVPVNNQNTYQSNNQSYSGTYTELPPNKKNTPSSLIANTIWRNVKKEAQKVKLELKEKIRQSIHSQHIQPRK